MELNLASLLGKIVVNIKVSEDNKELVLLTHDGYECTMYHCQDCCESVSIESIVGDLQDLIGNPLLMAEESTNRNDSYRGGGDSYTWTFYKFATIKGYVDIRWLGESNGYYSEEVSVSIRKM